MRAWKGPGPPVAPLAGALIEIGFENVPPGMTSSRPASIEMLAFVPLFPLAVLGGIADRHDESPASEDFGCRQPFFGGGPITAAPVPLIHRFGPWPLFITMSVVFVVARPEARPAAAGWWRAGTPAPPGHPDPDRSAHPPRGRRSVQPGCSAGTRAGGCRWATTRNRTGSTTSSVGPCGASASKSRESPGSSGWSRVPCR